MSEAHRNTIKLKCDISGHGLVQAQGTVNGREFYFRARHPNWTFEMANAAKELPSDVGGNQILFVEGVVFQPQ